MDHEPDPRRGVVTLIAAAIHDDWQTFGTMAASPSVQTFCGFESRYSDSRLSTDDPMSLVRFVPAGDTFDTTTAAGLLTTAHRRADDVVHGLVAAYRAHERRPLPEHADAHADATWTTLARILKGGMASLDTWIRRSEALPDETLRLNHAHEIMHLGQTLLMIAARARTADRYAPTDDDDAAIVGTSTPQHEIDAMIDETLREACQGIIRGDKHPIPPGAGPAERVFAECMNIVRTMYAQGRDRGFQQRLFRTRMLDRLAPTVRRGDYRDQQQYLIARQRIVFEAFAAFMNDLIGTTFAFPGTEKLNQMMLGRDAHAERRNEEAEFDEFIAVMVMTARIHATRHFVHHIADGSLRYSEIMRATLQLTMLPLQPRPVAELAEETLDWERLELEALGWTVLPAGVSGPRDEPRAAPTGAQTPVPLDKSRIADLWELGQSWDGAYIVRGVPNGTGAIRDEYYVLVLPDKATGKEHAVADSPKRGRGLYVFRAEQGDRFQEPITWREAFSQPRGEAVKQLGALCLRHVATLERNLLDALTCRAEQIEQRRLYLLGQRAARRAAKAA